ncbi:radical SAM family heme chaperone HemW [bacterium]|jgi:oxygen-independent coproporphyrinogen III oxidase|nr:radical SAM family heme chaperone HemW [bacterium]
MIQHSDSALSVYIHVPFCAKLCPYCAFYKQKWGKEREQAFVEATVKEIEWYGEHYPDEVVRTVFWGGGTPNILKRVSVERIMTALRNAYSFQDEVEITMEMNPGMSSKGKLAAFREAGINRVSLGVQSMNADELVVLGRNHTAENTHKTLKHIREVGFDNVSVDLMFGLPNSTVRSLQNSLDAVLDYDPEHLSTYGLTIESGTPFFRNQQLKVGQDMERKQFQKIITTLKKKDYLHYEVSNFSKINRESKHNMAYWELRPYIGLGPSAHSFFKGNRYSNKRSLDIYTRAPYPSAYLKSGVKPYSSDKLLKEYIMTGLRMMDGLSFSTVNDLFGVDIKRRYANTIQSLYALKLIYKPDHDLRVTTKGVWVLDEIVQQFL